MRPDRARLQTRTAGTVQKYLQRAEGLLGRLTVEMQLPEDAYPDPDEVVEYLRRNTGSWKWSSFRQYQASLVCFYQREFDRTGEPLFDATANEIRSLPWDKCKPESEVGKTSSRKRKGIPERDFGVLVANLATPKHSGKWAQAASRWLEGAMATGLRPCEWQDAKLIENDTLLDVQNAKATNGRANGDRRTIPVRPEDVVVIRAHLANLARFIQAGYSFHQIHKRCAEEVRRICVRIWGKDNPRRYALYSARHQFAANSKAQHSHEEVAALLGHGSIKTARRHYAPRRSAWMKWRNTLQPKPQQEPEPQLEPQPRPDQQQPAPGV